MYSDDRKFEQTEMTKTVIDALKTAIKSEVELVEGTFRPERPILKKYREMLALIEKGNMDVRLQALDF
jgi:hypothetical protein